VKTNCNNLWCGAIGLDLICFEAYKGARELILKKRRFPNNFLKVDLISTWLRTPEMKPPVDPPLITRPAHDARSHGVSVACASIEVPKDTEFDLGNGFQDRHEITDDDRVEIEVEQGSRKLEQFHLRPPPWPAFSQWDCLTINFAVCKADEIVEVSRSVFRHHSAKLQNMLRPEITTRFQDAGDDHGFEPPPFFFMPERVPIQ